LQFNVMVADALPMLEAVAYSAVLNCFIKYRLHSTVWEALSALMLQCVCCVLRGCPANYSFSFLRQEDIKQSAGCAAQVKPQGVPLHTPLPTQGKQCAFLVMWCLGQSDTTELLVLLEIVLPLAALAVCLGYCC
jgi:hypothetical protein